MIALACLVLGLALLPAPAAATDRAPIDRPAAGVDLLAEPRRLEQFLDTVVGRQLADFSIAGAAVAVVQGDRIVVAKGYGDADRERGIAFSANRTLVPVASITKLLTWTAVMQLVEQHRLDLHADVNTYLGNLRIPTTYAQPITLAHLMTHTAGFEDRSIGADLARDAGDLRPLDVFVRRHLPARVRPPGAVVAYTNYASALAGYIVEQVTGMPFERYVEARILHPLGMRDSTLEQPLPPELAARLAVGYTFQDGAYHAEPTPLTMAVPAAGLRSSASDIARFMMAHLRQTTILRPDSFGEMQRRQFSSHPRIGGWTYGFHTMQLNGQRLIGHAGALGEFHSRLELLPDHEVGLFVTYTGAGGWEAQDQLVQAFVDRYFPTPAAPAAVAEPASRERARKLSGSYLPTRSAFSTFEKLAALVEPITVRAEDDGQLVLVGYHPEPRRWVEREPWVYQTADGGDLLAFEVDEARATRMFLRSAPRTAFIKQPWYAGASLHAGLFGACALLFVAALVAPVGGWWKRRGHAAYTKRPPGVTWLAGAISVLNLLFLSVLAVELSDTEAIVYGLTPLLIGALWLPLAAALTGILLVLLLAGAWRRTNGGWRRGTLVALTALIFLLELNYWNLLGFRY